MKIVLLEDVKGQGKKGELVNVSDGYARNYLFPRNLAKVADNSVLKEIQAKEQSKKRIEQINLDEAKKLAESLKDKTVKISAKAGTQGRLFGAVTSKEVAASLQKQYGVEIDKRKINLESEIKSFGTFKAELKLNMGQSTTIFVMVVEEA